MPSVITKLSRSVAAGTHGQRAIVDARPFATRLVRFKDPANPRLSRPTRTAFLRRPGVDIASLLGQLEVGLHSFNAAAFECRGDEKVQANLWVLPPEAKPTPMLDMLRWLQEERGEAPLSGSAYLHFQHANAADRPEGDLEAVSELNFFTVLSDSEAAGAGKSSLFSNGHSVIIGGTCPALMRAQMVLVTAKNQ